MRALFGIQAALLTLIGILYFYYGFHERFLYTVFYWDIILHILGGAWVGFGGAWFFRLFGVRLSALQVIALALSVGLVWELFEYLWGIGGSTFMSYQADTIKDLADDILGGTLAALVIRRI